MPKDYLSMPKDDNSISIPTGTGFLTQDATATPKTSPLAYSNSVITIAIPSNAAEVVFLPSTALRVSNIVGMTTYYTQPASTEHVYCVSRMDSIYIVRDSADGTLNFYFVTV